MSFKHNAHDTPTRVLVKVTDDYRRTTESTEYSASMYGGTDNNPLYEGDTVQCCNGHDSSPSAVPPPLSRLPAPIRKVSIGNRPTDRRPVDLL
jgi:hypothetical protein